MKSNRLALPVKNIFYLSFTVIMSLLLLSSCSHKMSFLTSPLVPAAQGSVKVKKDNNNNYKISVDVTDLAEPKRLQPAKSTYVVWINTAEGDVKNVGQINTSTGMFSSKLKASLETVSTYKPTKVFITAEDDAAIQYPGPQMVLTTDSF